MLSIGVKKSGLLIEFLCASIFVGMIVLSTVSSCVNYDSNHVPIDTDKGMKSIDNYPQMPNATDTLVLPQMAEIDFTGTNGLSDQDDSDIQVTERENLPRMTSNQVEIGVDVGDKVPEFTMMLVGGDSVSSAALIDTGKPVFLFFFSTW